MFDYLLSHSFEMIAPYVFCVDRCFSNITEATDEIALITFAETAYEQHVDAFQWQSPNGINEQYCIQVISNVEAMVYNYNAGI